MAIISEDAVTAAPGGDLQNQSRNKVILEVKHLTVIFTGGEGQVTTAVRDLSFSLDKGETLGIVGESGSGKSVTSLSILGLIRPPAGKIVGGEILLYDEKNYGKDLLQMTERQIRAIRGKDIAMIFQEPMTSLNPVLTCGMQVSESIIQHLHFSKKEAKKKAIEWFEEVKLPRAREIFDSYPHQLSGGQRQRVMIAMAMSGNPRILIADEPTTALDVTVQKTILELMKDLQKRYGMSLLFITHDLALVKGFADRILVMNKGEAVETETTKVLFSSPKQAYTKGLLSCRPSGDTRLKKLPTVDDFIDQPGKVNYEKESTEERIQRHKKIYSNPPLMEVTGLETKFSSGRSGIFRGNKKSVIKAVDNISFYVYAGETLGIVGESGSGKTTLGRTILRLLKNSSGRIIFEGKDLTSMKGKDLRELRKEIQIIFQDPYSSLNPGIMSGEAIIEPMKVMKILKDDRERKNRVLELLVKVGLPESFYRRYPHELSGGQRQRVCIARALAVNPKLIICDESVSSLDVSVQAQVLNLLNDLKRESGFTYMFISHDLSVVKFMSDRLIVMKSGRIEEDGDTDIIYRNPQSPYTRMLLEAIPEI